MEIINRIYQIAENLYSILNYILCMVRGFVRNPEDVGQNSSMGIEDERDDVHYAWRERTEGDESGDYLSVVFNGEFYEIHLSEGGDRGWDVVEEKSTKEKARKFAVDYLRSEYDK